MRNLARNTKSQRIDDGLNLYQATTSGNICGAFVLTPNISSGLLYIEYSWI